MKFRLLAMLLVLALAAGCNSSGKKNPTQKEAALHQWNQARASVLSSLARSQYESGNLENSRKTVGEALRLDPKNSSLHVFSARLSIELGQLEPAQRELTLAQELDAKNAEADYFLGVVNQRWQKPQLAYEYYTSAAEKNSSELAYVMARGEMLVAMSRIDEALQVLQHGLDVFGHNPTLHHAIGQLLVDQRRYVEAAESLREASVLAPDDPLIREHLAMAYFYAQDYRPAADVFARLVAAIPNSQRSELWVALGECQLQLGRGRDARASFNTATELNPSSTTAWLSLSKSALQLGDARRAELALRKAMSLEPNSPEAHLMFGYIRLRQDRLAEAMTEFEKASSLDRGDPVSLCMIGFSLEKSGKPQQAIKYYAQALKIKPDDELAARLMASVDMGE